MAMNEALLKPLMLAACDGDERAYDRLLRDVASGLRTYLRGQLARYGRQAAGDVEDLVQETLIAIHRKRHTFDRSMPVTAWIHAIARYKLIDLLRAGGGRHSIPIDDVADILPAAGETGGASALDLARVMARLPARARELILKTRVRGYSVAEAAADAGMTEGAAKVAIHRGMKTLTRMYAV
jgi:RNA polymerase sigma factor (sigma-70 family)